ncbi:MAG TPA: aldo/keto reductase [Polyangiaceae bacterium]|nr:aldo/keto reductase [Polyangiaceae bacterium]
MPPEERPLAKVPRFLYGTAWKEERTEALTRLALDTGFTGIDTANQRKHYHEAGVGAALGSALSAGRVTRERLFLQTKFTHIDGQDRRLPYDRAAPVAVQVTQSFESSLEHLGTDYLDSYVLHGPTQRHGLGAADWEAWRAMEALARAGRTRYLGASNVSLEQLRLLCDGAAVAPAFVQNRCYARTGWDRAVREFAAARGIVYQGFSLLTANARELAEPAVTGVARRAGRSPAEVVFRFALAIGMLPLTGSSNGEHLRADLAVESFELLAAEVSAIERMSG